jgi:hypothetical protein
MLASQAEANDPRPVCPPCKHADEISGVAIIPDGRWGLTACRKEVSGMAEVQGWELKTGRPVTPPFRVDGSAFSLALGPEGTSWLAAVSGKNFCIFDLSHLSR